MAGFRTALATGPWQAAVESCLATLGPEPGGRLGFLYATDHLAGALPAILAALTKATGTADWVGTVGLGVAGQDADGAPLEPFDQPALAVMLTDLNPITLQIRAAAVCPFCQNHITIEVNSVFHSE